MLVIFITTASMMLRSYIPCPNFKENLFKKEILVCSFVPGTLEHPFIAVIWMFSISFQ